MCECMNKIFIKCTSIGINLYSFFDIFIRQFNNYSMIEVNQKRKNTIQKTVVIFATTCDFLKCLFNLMRIICALINVPAIILNNLLLFYGYYVVQVYICFDSHLRCICAVHV